MTIPAVERYAGTPGEWDEFVRRQHGWTTFHLHAWKPLLEELFGHECPYLAVRGPGGTLTGVLPLVRVKSLLFGHYLVSMPFVNYGGPLGDARSVRQLAEEAVALGQLGRVKLLELRCRLEMPFAMPASHRKITVVLDLPADTESLRKSIGSKLRSQIKRPEKEGVKVRFGADQVEPFFEVFSRHMRDLGTPTQPLRFFKSLTERFGDEVVFGCAWLGHRPVAAGAGFRWDREFEMTWAASLYEFNRISPNMLLYWAFMERAIAAGMTIFNFGRCSVDSGTHRFKRQWGSRDETLWWYQDAIGSAAATPSPDAGAYSLGPKLWKHLPVGIATALGPRIVRSIP